MNNEWRKRLVSQRALKQAAVCGLTLGLVAGTYGVGVAAAATTSTTAKATTSTTVKTKAAAVTTTTGVTTTTVPKTTTTLPPIKQVTTHGSSTVQNDCTSHLDPPLAADSPTSIGVTLSTDANPQPHLGDPITLSGTSVKLSIPAALLQTGVDAGIISDGMKVPSTVTVAVNGSNTKEKTHTFKFSATSTIKVVNGQAVPLTATNALPNTKWTPADKTAPVFFTESSLNILSTIDLTATLGEDVTVTFTCTTPADPPSFVALAATGTTPPTTVAPPTTAATIPVTTPVTAAAVANTLPRTGSNAAVPLSIAGGSILLGLAALGLSSRKRRPFMQ